MDKKKVSENYMIVLDTNLIWIDDKDYSKLFNAQFFDVLEFIKKHKSLKNFKVCIPKVVLNERIFQRIEQIEPKIKSINEKKEELKEFIEIKITSNGEIRDILQKKADEIIKDNNIIILDYPEISQKEITEEACSKKSPFFNKGKQEYKDKIIWETIKENAKKDKKNYLFITNNHADFDEITLKSEFERISSNKFEIFTDIGSLKVYLDEIFDLRLNLEGLYKRKREEIEDNLNKILYNLSGERKGFSWNGKETFIANVLIEEFNIENITENLIYADIEIKGKAKFFEREKKESEGEINLLPRSYSLPTRSYLDSIFERTYEERDVTIKIKLNLTNYSIMNSSISEGSYLPHWTRGYF